MADSDGIDELLGQMLQSLVELEQTLREESVVMTSKAHDPAAVDAIALHKHRLVVGLDGLVQAGDRLLLARGFSAGREGMENWLRHLPDTHPVRGVWRSILEISARCKEMNEINGVQIGLLSRRAQEAMNILLGGSGASQTYGRDGGTDRVVSPFHTSYKA